MNLLIRTATFDEIMLVHSLIPEFQLEVSRFDGRHEGKDALMLVACLEGNEEEPIGYMLSYDRFNDNSYYCWLAGTLPQYRNCGVLSALMDATITYAKEKGYTKICIKTRNRFKNMLSFLIKNQFNITNIEQKDGIDDYRIWLEKEIG